MGPDVNAPTDTVRTGLIVPVELTTVSTRPRVTGTVRYFGALRSLSQAPSGMLRAPSPITAIITMVPVNQRFMPRLQGALPNGRGSLAALVTCHSSPVTIQVYPIRAP